MFLAHVIRFLNGNNITDVSCVITCVFEKFCGAPRPQTTQHHKAQSIVCFVYRCTRRVASFTPQILSTVTFHTGLRMPSPSLRCQARRPQSKKVRLAVILPSGLDVKHNHQKKLPPISHVNVTVNVCFVLIICLARPRPL